MKPFSSQDTSRIYPSSKPQARSILHPKTIQEAFQSSMEIQIDVHLRSHLIMNGVCVRWRGWIDLDRLDGVGCLEYDEERAAEEDALLRDQLERYNQRLRDFEEKQRAYRSGAASAAQPPHLNHHYHHDTHHAASHHHHHHGHHSRHVGGAGATGATATGIEPHLPHRQDPEMEVRLRAY
ncbi:Protein big brother [Camponotus floridanus]|uniref:Protein big brother n=1 Tax=Camponotus floridanus TaxID=104421 RepID=E2A3R6_CAMFO|nr:Protein big brother [Camponotus floridanus]